MEVSRVVVMEAPSHPGVTGGRAPEPSRALAPSPGEVCERQDAVSQLGRLGELPDVAPAPVPDRFTDPVAAVPVESGAQVRRLPDVDRRGAVHPAPLEVPGPDGRVAVL